MTYRTRCAAAALGMMILLAGCGGGGAAHGSTTTSAPGATRAPATHPVGVSYPDTVQGGTVTVRLVEARLGTPPFRATATYPYQVRLQITNTGPTPVTLGDDVAVFDGGVGFSAVPRSRGPIAPGASVLTIWAFNLAPGTRVRVVQFADTAGYGGALQWHV